MDLTEWFLALIAHLLSGISIQIGSSNSLLYGLILYAVLIFTAFYLIGWPIYNLVSEV